MKKLLTITILLFASSFALAQNECPSGTYVPSWGKFTTSDGVTHQTVCIDASAKWTLPLTNKLTPPSIAISAAGSVASPALSIAGTNTPAFFNDTSFLGMGITYAGVTQIYVISFGITVGPGVYAASSTINGAPDVGISRCAANKYCLGNGTATDATGTWNAAEYQVGGVASSGTGGIARTTSTVLTTPSITSPTINGTPSGTGISTVTLKKGSGSGNYTSASTTYVVVDSTNLCYTVTIPTGWKLVVTLSADVFTNTAITATSFAITDNAACNTANAGVVMETSETVAAAGAGTPISFTTSITGDGASHNLAAQFKTSNAADSVGIVNSSATLAPTMTFLLTPSN